MQNKANFKKAKININIYIKKDYENLRLYLPAQNKAKQSQFSKKVCLNTRITALKQNIIILLAKIYHPKGC